jgi:UPF0755 protein
MQRKQLYMRVVRIFISLLMLTLLGGYWLLKKPNILLGKETKVLLIKPNISFAVLQKQLYQEGYVADTCSFSLLAKMLKYDRKIFAGAYRLLPNMSNWECISLLKRGKQAPVKLILDHVYTKTDLVRKVAENTNIVSKDLTTLLEDSNFAKQLGFNVENILAMFIPNTYEVYWTITPKQFIYKMHHAYEQFWDTTRRNKAARIGLTPIEVMILASIVQKETNKLAEAPIIAGIYLNRLRKGMCLQACPTLLYATGNPAARRVLHKYKLIDSPYNTYMYAGLPPGPICIPTIAMIEAVLDAQQHQYLYFSAKEDFSGFHYFAKTFHEHKINGEKFRRKLNKAKIYK